MISNANPLNTMLELINHTLSQHPDLAQHVEKISQNLQGKGWGSDSIAREVECLMSFTKTTPKLAVDIGGNVGNYSAELRLRNPQAEIHVFEPSSTNLQKLEQRFGNDAGVVIVPAAVSDTEGTATLFSDNPGSGLGSLTKRKLDHFGIPFDTQESVALMRFEDYWESNLRRRHIDLLKLDIEGHELSALRGFGRSIDNISVIQFEFGGCNIDTRTFFRDFWYFFTDAGFILHRITPASTQVINQYREIDEFFSTTNYIAVKRQ
jgi:FkbM family methyltransferase